MTHVKINKEREQYGSLKVNSFRKQLGSRTLK